jgi:hypothetical protein
MLMENMVSKAYIWFGFAKEFKTFPGWTHRLIIALFEGYDLDSEVNYFR